MKKTKRKNGTLWFRQPSKPEAALLVQKVFRLVLGGILIAFTAITTNAQTSQKTVSGVVLDSATGRPMAGATVKVKNSKVGTATDLQGKFTIKANENAVFDISTTGYKMVEAIAKNGNLQVSMAPLPVDMSEVVVIGYGTQKRSSLTGAVSSVSGKTISALPVASVEQALQGRVAGLSVTNNGSPGTSPIVAIRGISSISFASSPLYVIDGFPTGNLSNFDSKDIESVEVLKDASAAAIYGSRATNGVIIITTKKGRRDGRMQVNFDSYVGVQSPSKKIDLLNTNQYVQYERSLDGAAGIGLPPRLQATNFNMPIYAGTTQTYAQTTTDWQDAYFKKNAIITQHNISMSGGNEVSRFFISAGYFKQDGIAQGLSYERGNFRINSDHILNKVLTFGENMYLSVGNQHYDATSGNRTPLTNVIRMQPYLPVYDPTTQGGFRGPQNSFDGADPTNPVEAALIGSNTIQNFKILGSAYLDAKLAPWLRFRSTFGVDYTNSYQQNYTPIYNDGGTLSATLATIANQRQPFTTLLYTEQLNFDKSFGQHHVTATAVYEQQAQSQSTETMSGNQSTNDVKTLNGATNTASNTRYESNLIISYVGRVTYDYMGKYLLSAAIRRDGLSVWAPNHKFGNFPSASIGWRIDQEKFMKAQTRISELKLRAGYGITGLNGTVLGNYPWQVGVQSSQASYPFGGALSIGNASYYNALANPNLEWETTKQINFGLDLGLFNNKLTVTAEYFKRKTDNLILNVPTPTSFGFGGNGALANVAAMQNNGFELQVGYHKNTGAFKWDLTGLVSVIRNKVISLNTDNASITAGGDGDFGGGDPLTNTVAGQPVQSFYGYVTDGIFQTAAQVASSATQVSGLTAPGDIKFKDLNGDGKITDADRTFIGSYLPKFTYSLNYSLNYMNFDAAVFFQGVEGNKIFNAERITIEGMPRLFNAGTQVLNAWSAKNTNTNIPRAISGDPNKNGRPSTRWIEDGSYLRVKNLMVGYNLPEASLKSVAHGAITRFRIYLSAQNLLTFTKYTGWDPEIGSKNGTLTNGVDYGQYPSARSFQLGVQVGF